MSIDSKNARVVSIALRFRERARWDNGSGRAVVTVLNHGLIHLAAEAADDMTTVFVAGASGVVGRTLIPLLAGKGWRVVGLTRDAQKQSLISKLGAEPVIADVFDKVALSRLVEAAKPQVIIHQLTDLPPGLNPIRMAEATKRNARIRDEGTRNIVEIAIKYGVERFIAQSVAFA